MKILSLITVLTLVCLVGVTVALTTTRSPNKLPLCFYGQLGKLGGPLNKPGDCRLDCDPPEKKYKYRSSAKATTFDCCCDANLLKQN